MTEIDSPLIAIVGAGEQGKMTIALVGSELPDARFHVFDRSADALAKVQSLHPDSVVKTTRTDVLKDGLPGLAGADLVVNFAGPFFAGANAVARAAIDARVPYVDICDDAEGTRAVLGLADEAEAAGIGLVVSAGITPGISNVLARRLVDQDDTVDGIRVVWVIRDEDPGGLAPLRHMLHMAVVPAPVWIDGKATTSAGYSPKTASLHVLPEPVGEITAFDTSHPEPVTLPRAFPHLKYASCQGALLPQWSNDMFAMLGKIGFGDPSLTVEVGGQIVEPAEVLWKLLWARYDSRPGLTRRTLTLVQVQGLRGDEVVSTGTVYDDHSMVRTTGLGAASAVLQLLRDPAPAGAWGTEVLDPIPTLETFERLASSIGAVPHGVRFDTALSGTAS